MKQIDHEATGSELSKKGEKKLFERIWSEDDEIVLLNGMIDHPESLVDMNIFLELIKDNLHFAPIKRQVQEKIRRLKKKYLERARSRFGKKKSNHEQKCYELSEIIWKNEIVDSVVESIVTRKRRTMCEGSMCNLSYNPSASSLTDMSVGSTHVTLAPPSSSLNLRSEFLSGFNKDPFPPQVLSMNTSSASVDTVNELQSQCQQIRSLLDQLAFAERSLKMSVMSAMDTISEFAAQKSLILELQNRLADEESKFVEGEKLRKKLHNTILELKGNIRVFCRVRPLLSDDGPEVETKIISFPTSTETVGRGIDLTQNGKKLSFTFDKVFIPETSQEDVFVEISQLVQSALDGYKVCIFAYGQTGSGKTYTMMGKSRSLDQKGLIPRSLEQVFETKQILQSQGWKYEMQVSMLEIYNETIRDLLAQSKSGTEASRVDNGGKQYAIKHDVNGNTHVSDLTIVDVCSSNEVCYLLERAAQSRSVGKTQMNEQSSRSHFVFTLRIVGFYESTGEQVQGVLNLIDLAGSERLSKSGSTRDRLKETKAINKSLSSLRDVIFALTKKEEHVPCRNSKLTYLLQPCFGGDSKTLMFVNVSPDPSSVSESLCSLRFAARVNAC